MACDSAISVHWVKCKPPCYSRKHTCLLAIYSTDCSSSGVPPQGIYRVDGWFADSGLRELVTTAHGPNSPDRTNPCALKRADNISANPRNSPVQPVKNYEKTPFIGFFDVPAANERGGEIFNAQWDIFREIFVQLLAIAAARTVLYIIVVVMSDKVSR